MPSENLQKTAKKQGCEDRETGGWQMHPTFNKMSFEVEKKGKKRILKFPSDIP